MTKILLVLVVAAAVYGYYSGWFDLRGSRGEGQAAACAKARATIQDIESRATTGGGGLADPGAQKRLAEAREYVRANCR